MLSSTWLTLHMIKSHMVGTEVGFVKGEGTVLFRLVVHPVTTDFEIDQSAIRVTSLARANAHS